MARTEFHSKLEEQIEAIKSVAKETQGVATAITALEERPNLADSVIALATDLMVTHCVAEPTPVGDIESGELSEGDPQTAFTDLEFDDDKLKALYAVICPSALQQEPEPPPPTSPPREKGSAKKR